MSSPSEIIIRMLRRASMTPRKAVDLAVQTASECECERETADALAGVSGIVAAWARAALIERIDGPDSAEPLWKRVVSDTGCEVPEALLHRARAAARRGQPQDAALLLRLGLSCGPDYDFFNRAEALVRKCKGAFTTRRKVRIALLGSSTTALLRSVVEMLCLRDGLEPVIYEQPFGAYGQEILQDDSGLYRFGPEFILLLLNWRDLGLPHHCPDAEVSKTVERLSSLWRTALERTSSTLVHCSFVPPAADPYSALSSVLLDGRARAIRRINESLRKAAPDRVAIIDGERLAEAHAGAWEDPIQWSSTKLYPATSAFPVLAEHVVSCIRAELGLSKKLLVVDLDNTLWGGVVGEDGIGGIRLGPPSAEGERYQDLQRYLRGLGERGVLLAVVSKNNAEDAKEVFRQHAASVLRLDDFVAFKANWTGKAQNIRQLATELQLGLDGFVFLDDNPGERNAVRQELPDVLVPEISGEPSETIATLERGLYFQATRLTAEDTIRSASYLAKAGQEDLRLHSTSMDEFLNDLQMKIDFGSVDDTTAVRVTQLINKTNQFNLTTRRYSQNEVLQKMQSPDYWFRWYRLRDRFADHGVIAILLAHTGAEWGVDLWLMSCRVIGRGVEEFMFRDLVSAAGRAGARHILAHFIPTAKNQPVKDLLPRLGFSGVAGSDDYTLDVKAVVLPPSRFHAEEALIETQRA
jgi:FkbH-like protein